MLKLMIADDERVVRENMATLIDWNSLGVELTGICKDGVEAYNMILDDFPDIVMTDIRMPGLTGLDLVRCAREGNLDMEFIILSGYEEFEYAREAIKYGVRQYLVKPCEEEQIQESIKQVVQECCEKKKKDDKKVIRQIREIYDRMQNAKEEKIAVLTKELTDIIESTVSVDALKLIAGSLSIYFTSDEICSPSEIAEFMLKVNKEEDVQELQKMIREIILWAKIRVKHKMDAAESVSEQIMKYVKTHISDPDLTLKKIAEEYLYMNVDYVSKKFLKTTGMKFSQYLTEERIDKAKELLLAPEPVKIQNVAERVGCGNNPQYFSQIFKRVVGKTPSNWLESVRCSNV